MPSPTRVDSGSASRTCRGAVEYTPTSMPRLCQCFGWTRVGGGQLFALPWRRRPPRYRVRNVRRELNPGEDYYAIVYEYVPAREAAALATAEDIQPQLD